VSSLKVGSRAILASRSDFSAPAVRFEKMKNC